MKSLLTRLAAALLGALLVAGLLQAVVHAQAPTTRAAVLSSPVIVADFTAGTLPAGWTLTRASAGTRFNSSGVLVSETTDVARFTWDPANLAAGPSLLVEPQRTNLLLRSALFANAAYTKNHATATDAAADGPAGSNTASTVVEDATTNAHWLFQSVNYGDGTWCHSVFAKAAGRNWLSVMRNDSSTTGAYFNLSTGAIGTIQTGWSAGITAAGNGWYRPFSAAALLADLKGWGLLMATADGGDSYAGDGVSGINLYGAQLELASDGKTSSYIPTAGATVTRSADVLTRAGLQNGTYTVIVERVSGTTVLTGQAVSNGTFTAPTDVSGVRKITLRRN